VYGTSDCLPTSDATEQPVSGADPPLVFNLWMNEVLVRLLPPVGPRSSPITSSNRHAIEPAFGQLDESEPAGIEPTACAHTLLLSNELCHVALPKGSGSGALSLGVVFGLRK